MQNYDKKLESKADKKMDYIENKKNTSDLGYSNYPLCREPWESYYILRRGILPCCYGNPIVAPMKDWSEAWNSAEVQEIRSYLSQGKLSPYCRESLGCPIVQRVLAEENKKNEYADLISPPPPLFLRIINRLLLRVPAKIYNYFKKNKTSI